MPYNNPWAGSSVGYAQQPAYGGPTPYANPFQDPQYRAYWDNTLLDDPSKGGKPMWGRFTELYGGDQQFQNWLDNQYEKRRTQYEGKAALDSTYRWFDDLKNWNARQEYENLSPYQRDRNYRPNNFVKFNQGWS